MTRQLLYAHSRAAVWTYFEDALLGRGLHRRSRGLRNQPFHEGPRSRRLLLQSKQIKPPSGFRSQPLTSPATALRATVGALRLRSQISILFVHSPPTEEAVDVASPPAVRTGGDRSIHLASTPQLLLCKFPSGLARGRVWALEDGAPASEAVLVCLSLLAQISKRDAHLAEVRPRHHASANFFDCEGIVGCVEDGEHAIRHVIARHAPNLAGLSKCSYGSKRAFPKTFRPCRPMKRFALTTP